MKNKELLSVILPTYNEAGNIVRLIRKISDVLRRLPYRVEIIVVDDNSPDGTARLIEKHFSGRSLVRVIIRRSERGLASAIHEGIQQSHGSIIAVMDTDFNHDPQVLATMLKLPKDRHLLIGSRYIAGGGMENRARYWGSYLFNVFLRFILGIPTHDSLSGFFMILRKDLMRLPLRDIFYGFGEYFIRLIYYARNTGYTLKETPVYYPNRVWGQSKSRLLSMLLSYGYAALKLRFQ